jgi:hypothetical protein
MFKSLLAAAALLLTATGAEATPVLETITFTGTVASGWDGSAQFGPVGSIAGAPYSITLAFDPAALSADTCGSASNNSCNWNFGAGTTEAITINGVTKTYAATSGTIQYCACGGDSIYIQAHGAGGLYFGGSFQDSTTLFKSQANVNNPLLLVDVAKAALINGQFQSSGLGGNTSFNVAVNAITDHYGSAVAAARVPEAPSLAFLLAGAMMLGMFATGRRNAARVVL